MKVFTILVLFLIVLQLKHIQERFDILENNLNIQNSREQANKNMTNSYREIKTNILDNY